MAVICTKCWQEMKGEHACPPLMTETEIKIEARLLERNYGKDFLNKSLGGLGIRYRMLTAPNAVGYVRKQFAASPASDTEAGR